MLFHYLESPGSIHYSEQLCLDVSGEIDLSLFEKAWNFTIQINEMLRAVFRWETVDKPIQIILNGFCLHPEFHEFPGKSGKEARKSVEEIKARERKKGFDLRREVPFRVVLCKLEKNRYQLIISNHHILYDGWSSGIILKDFFDSYEAFADFKEPVKPSRTKFKEFIKSIQNRDTAKQEAFWKNYLNGFDTHTGLSIKETGKEKDPTGVKKIDISLSMESKGELEGFVGTRKTTLASLFYCAWGILLQKYNNTGDVVFGTTVSGRPPGIPGIEEMVGLLINTLPLRVQCSPGEEAEDLLYKIDNVLKQRAEFETVSLVDINEALFDSILVIENYPLDKRLTGKKGKLSVESFTMIESTHYDLTVGITLFEEITISFIYNEGVFDNRGIHNMSRHFENIIRFITAEPRGKISEIDIITSEEKNKILYEFNKTGSDYPKDKTIHQLFEEQVRRTPDAAAVNGTHRTYKTYMTYAGLNREADRLAGLLKERGLQPGGIAGIMTDPSIEMIVGILGILKAGGAYLPIDPAYPEERKQYMLKDSNANVLVTAHPTRITQLTQPTHLAHLTHLTQACYIIYTSGTTGKPKGVLLEHRSVVNTLLCRKEEYKMGLDDCSLQLFSYTFDGFVTSFFTPVISGASVTLLDKGHMGDIAGIIDVIIKHKVTHFICVPALYRAILEALEKEETKHLKVITLAGDRVFPELMEMTKQKSGFIEISHEYGVTEAAVMSTLCRHQQKKKEITIGKPAWNTSIFIVDRDNRLQPVGVPGELCIGGEGVARGYLNRPELTAERFYRSYKTYKSYRTYVFYRTGDLARWLPGGHIEFLGRIDHQVKIRGFRIETGEIENRLSKHPEVNEAVVLARESCLCAYIVPSTVPTNIPAFEAELKEYLNAHLPRYMVPSYFITMERIPLTSIGKIDRKALPGPETTMTENYTAPKDDVERKLVEIWAEVLEMEPTHIGTGHDFFSLGGHSLKATRLISKIHKKMDVKIPMDILFEHPTVKGLAGYVKKTEKEMYSAIEKVEEREYYPLSGAQKRLYITGYMELESVVYNVQNVVRLEGGFSPGKLEETFRELIARHESFRTSFHVIDETPVQKIHETVDFALEAFPLTPYRQFLPLISHFIRPFDLSRPPLLRAGLLKTGEEDFILVTDIHHIIADGVSMGVFVKEFAALYRGEELPPLRIQYKDFVLWRREFDESPGGREAMGRQAAYWLKEFEGEVPRLDLPLDYTRPPILEYDGAVVVFELDGETEALLKKTASEEDVTLFTVLLAIVYVLLNKICDREDVVVGTPVAGRGHADLEKVMGLFVNMLALRNRPTAGKRFRDFLKEVKEKTLTALDNRDYPYEELVDTLSVTRDPARNPLFDVLFVWEDPDTGLGYITPSGELKLTPYNVEKTKAMFDIILTSTEFGGKMTFSINYRTSLFKRETIESMSGNFKEVLSAVLKDPGIKLGDIVISHDLLAAVPRSLLEDRGDFGF